jgi:hypothetical protein
MSACPGRHAEDTLAAVGQLWCLHCSDRLAADLVKAGDLVEVILRNKAPRVTAALEPQEGSRSKGDPPAPLNLSAVADADDLHAAIAELAEIVMAERRVTGPGWGGSDVRPAHKRRTAFGDLVYSPARVVGLRQSSATAQVAGWLGPHVPWIVAAEEAVGAVEALLALYGRLAARWDGRERARYVPAPCPGCDLVGGLLRYPPTVEEQVVVLECQHCKHSIPEKLQAEFLEAAERAARRAVPRQRRGAA